MKKDSIQGSVVISNSIELSLLDSNGTDLLNPLSKNAINHTEIKIFYLIDGKIQEIFDKRKDFPRNFLVFKHKTKYRIRIFLNSQKNEVISETYVQWSEFNSDTIKAEFNKSNSSLTIKKIWFNNKEVWRAGKSERYFTLIK